MMAVVLMDRPTRRQLLRIEGQRLKVTNRKEPLRYMILVDEVPMTAIPDGFEEKGSCVV